LNINFIKNEIQNILNKIENNNCGLLKLENIDVKNNIILIVLNEIIGVIDDSREYYLRNDLFYELKTKLNSNIKILIK